MKDYDIQTIEYNGCKTCIIFSTHYISLLKYIKEIQLEYSELLKECNEEVDAIEKKVLLINDNGEINEF